MELLQVLFSSITFFILLLAIYKFPFNTPKKHLPPSPPGALPIIGHLRLLFTPLHRTLQAISTNSNQYAHYMLLKLGTRNLLVLSSPAAMEECFHKKDVALANRPRSIAADYNSYDYTAMGMANHGPLWRNLRRITATEIFSSTSLQASSSIRHDAVRCLLRDLYRSTTSNNEGTQNKIDLKLKFFELTFNVMMSMFTGDPIGDGLCHTEEYKWFFKLLRNARVPHLFMAPGDYLPIFKYFDVFKVEKTLAAMSVERDAFFEEIIERCRKKYNGEKKSKSILDVFFSLQQADPEQYNDLIIKGMILTMFTAGTDTSAMALEWAMSLLLNHPETLKKAVDELNNNIIEPNRLLKDSDISDLPYIQSIVQETLRLYPPVPLLLPHEVAQESKVDRYDVPSGTIVVANVWAIQRDPKVWPEPDKFMPERFMQSILQGESKDGFKFVPFGIGRRGCPGGALAIRIIALALASVLWCFEWEKIGDEPIDMSEEVQFLLPRAKPLEALCRPRSEMLNVMSQV
ncbi:hypothetical protein Syun_008545 [Stephania yunnanensis]|uniref:Cytochrome P450 n=1 Tax=Stephania yunnanensis TaxID=152371 RepID=A0AAP0PRG3_9MAGN